MRELMCGATLLAWQSFLSLISSKHEHSSGRFGLGKNPKAYALNMHALVDVAPL